MKNLYLLFFFLLCLSVSSQINPVISKADSIRNARIQDSLQNIELQESLSALLFPENAAKAKHTADSLRQVHVQDSIRDKLAKDNLRAKQIQDSILSASTKLEIPKPLEPKQDSLIKAVVKDTIIPNPIPTPTITPVLDSVKAKPVLDSIPSKPVKDSIVPKLPVDSVKLKPVQDSLVSKPKQDSIIPVKLPDIQGPPVFPDTLVPKQLTDSLTPEQILNYYLNEPEPMQFYKGPTVGDSVYYVLNPLTVPTQTNEGYALSNHGNDEEEEFDLTLDTAKGPELGRRPKISLGYGSLGFKGDLYQKHFQSPTVGRSGMDLAISHRLTPYLQLDFTVLFGKLGANENLLNRHENFQSEIRAGGVNVLYDFGNLIPARYTVRPFVSLGLTGFEFLSKTDLKDKNGNTYFYWSDGSIKDKPEGSADAQNAKVLVRDYKYESDIRELNKDGFGKYQERSWAIPLGVGFIMKVTNRVDLKLNFQYFLTTTDYIDGISNKSIGDRVGNKNKDNFTYTSFALQYDLMTRKPGHKPYVDTISNSTWLAMDNEDEDEDGVIDLLDDCLGTAKGAKVNEKGCPLDGDGDGIPDYRDDELNTALGMPVNQKGVSQTDSYWQAWYDQYLNDTLATDRTTEYTGNIYASKTKKPKEKKDNFTVELVRYTGSIPSDELAFLLSIGDINSTTLDDGTTVVYTSGSYDKLGSAIKRRDEFRTEGNKGAGISRIQGKEIVQVPDEELQRLLNSELEELLSVKIGDTTAVKVTTPNAEEVFSKEDIVYRVQLGAFKNKISTSVFNTSAGVLELKTGESIYRYVTKGYKSIEEAASVRADLVVQGYSDAFVTAYKGGKRIPMNQTKATMDKSYKEDLSEDKIFNSIDKKLLAFKVQLGPLKKQSFEAMMDEKVKDLPKIEKQTTASGSLRYTSGAFQGLEAAEKHRKELEDKGFTDAFIIATFKNDVISIQEAMELLK